MTNVSICSIDGCSTSVLCRGWCSKHYQRWQRHGDPVAMLIHRHEGTPEERFWAKVNKTDGCWLWTARTNAFGYGSASLGHERSALAHRVAYEYANGPIPKGMELDHVCRTRACVRPDHLRLATRKQNNENQGLRCDNTSGVRGVSWLPKQGKWLAQVHHNKTCYRVGLFLDLGEAEEAVKAKRNELFSHNVLDRR